jgi:hypothetical protein
VEEVVGLGESEDLDCELLADAEAAIRALSAAGYEVVVIATAVPAVAKRTLQFLADEGLVGGEGAPISASNVLFCLDPKQKVPAPPPRRPACRPAPSPAAKRARTRGPGRWLIRAPPVRQAEIMRQMGGFVAAIDRSWPALREAHASTHGVRCSPCQPTPPPQSDSTSTARPQCASALVIRYIQEGSRKRDTAPSAVASRARPRRCLLFAPDLDDEFAFLRDVEVSLSLSLLCLCPTARATGGAGGGLWL